MAVSAGDAAFQEPGAAAIGLHPRIVVGLECNTIEIAESVEQVTRHVSEVGGIADAITEAVDDEAMRSKGVVSEMDRIADQTVDWREGRGVERPDERYKLWAALRETGDFIEVTMDGNVPAQEG